MAVRIVQIPTDKAGLIIGLKGSTLRSLNSLLSFNLYPLSDIKCLRCRDRLSLKHDRARQLEGRPNFLCNLLHNCQPNFRSKFWR